MWLAADPLDDAIGANILTRRQLIVSQRTVFGNCNAHHHLRHQELRHHEEGPRLARQAGVAYDFHDYKTAGIDRERLERWEKKVGWETLLNRAGTTFRKLPDKDKAVSDAKTAIALMLKQPSMIKRPVLDLGRDRLLVGFKPELYEKALG